MLLTMVASQSCDPYQPTNGAVSIVESVMPRSISSSSGSLKCCDSEIVHGASSVQIARRSAIDALPALPMPLGVWVLPWWCVTSIETENDLEVASRIYRSLPLYEFHCGRQYLGYRYLNDRVEE
jgi:hypothetical protein